MRFVYGKQLTAGAAALGLLLTVPVSAAAESQACRNAEGRV
jgi:hypothetical protein